MKPGNVARIGAVITASSLAVVAQAGGVQAQTTASATPSATTARPLTSTATVPTSSRGTSEVALPEGDECPLVQLVAINGTTESTRNSKTDADTGWMARVVSPTVRAANADGQARMSRTYVPYPASFGGFVPSEDQSSYAESVTVGIENGRK